MKYSILDCYQKYYPKGKLRISIEVPTEIEPTVVRLLQASGVFSLEPIFNSNLFIKELHKAKVPIAEAITIARSIKIDNEAYLVPRVHDS